MSKQTASIPKGTRDFGPQVMVRRNFILSSIKSVFKKYGFLPLETPSMENLSVLMGKYGDEGDQLIFKILNSGDYLSKTTQEEIDAGSRKLTRKISEKGLRYDLTVPFARYVAMNRNEIAFPFRRFQIQPVWRADRPQKGRYREFFQCDADVVGTKSLICEAEIVLMIKEIFSELKIEDYAIKVNNRKILTGITEAIGATGLDSDFCVAIDKLDKIGVDKVLEELKAKAFTSDSLKALKPILELKGSNDELLAKLEIILRESTVGMEGINELKSISRLIESFGNPVQEFEIDITLARGLSYYTGSIFEVKLNDNSIGSLSGGGRYDDLTGVFGLPDVSGVGFSLGVDRIYDVLDRRELFPSEVFETSKVMISNFDESSMEIGLKVLSQLRSSGINSEIYPDSSKLKKQMNYADKKQIPFVIIIGSEEIESGLLTFKDMSTGVQKMISVDDIINQLNQQH